MPDLFDPLRGTPDQLGRPPLPAEEVRRRGDRRRRRSTVAAAAGAALAVALVVSGGLALGGGLTTDSSPSPQPPATQAPTGEPEPTPEPDIDWLTSIPAGFPLADDLEQPTSSEEELAGPDIDVRVFDVPFEACGRKADLGAPVDTLGVRYTMPEWFDGRVLQVYADEAAARQVLFELVRLYEFCEEDVFPGPPDTVATSTIRPVPHGEEGYVVTRTFSVDGLRVPGLELLHVVRTGNALLVATLSNEGGVTDASVARQLGERDPLIEDVAAAMCIFGAEGCSSGRPEDPATPLEGALLGIGDVRELTRDLRTSWSVVPGGDRTPLDCWDDPVDVLDPLAVLTRAFEGTASNGVVNTRAATAVLELGDTESARSAYEAVVSGLEDCGDAFGHDAVLQRTPAGPATWGVVERAAPEICTECDTGWIDAQAVALVDSRVVLLSLAYTGDMMSGGGSGGGSPMTDAINRATRLAADPPSTTVAFGPLGVGPVDLGDSATEAEAGGSVTFEDSHGSGCTTFSVLDQDGRNLAVGYVDPDLGVAAFFASQGVNTPQGVGVGSTPAEVEAAYPGLEETPGGLSARVPGHDDRAYVFTFEGDQVMEVALVLDGHACFG